MLKSNGQILGDANFFVFEKSCFEVDPIFGQNCPKVYLQTVITCIWVIWKGLTTQNFKKNKTKKFWDKKLTG
jgi:hypothetical protein